MPFKIKADSESSSQVHLAFAWKCHCHKCWCKKWSEILHVSTVQNHASRKFETCKRAPYVWALLIFLFLVCFLHLKQDCINLFKHDSYCSQHSVGFYSWACTCTKRTFFKTMTNYNLRNVLNTKVCNLIKEFCRELLESVKNPRSFGTASKAQQ